MKKIAIAILLLGSIFVSKAQDNSLKPYISGGISVGGTLPTLGGELGVYNHNYWVAIVTEVTKGDVYMGPKLYVLLHDVSKESQFFAYGAMKLHITGIKTFAFEPGLCYVYNIGSKWAVQVSASSPIYEGQQLGNPINFSGGLSLNYWIK